MVHWRQPTPTPSETAFARGMTDGGIELPNFLRNDPLIPSSRAVVPSSSSSYSSTPARPTRWKATELAPFTRPPPPRASFHVRLFLLPVSTRRTRSLDQPPKPAILYLPCLSETKFCAPPRPKGFFIVTPFAFQLMSSVFTVFADRPRRTRCVFCFPWQGRAAVVWPECPSCGGNTALISPASTPSPSLRRAGYFQH